jgi:4-amino-4-deoxy-L-arabinose transferase-like glycosyltransferase
MTSRQHIILATVLAILGLYVMRLTAVEIQPAPEGLIASRGEAIAMFDTWSDQSQRAPGGITTASKPPLSSWMVALGMAVVGKTPLAVRWFSIVAAIGACLGTFLVGRRVLTFPNAVLAMVTVGTSMPFILYARQANDVVPFTAFALVAVHALLVLIDGAVGVRRVLISVVLALSVAACILTMPVAAFVLIASSSAVLGRPVNRWYVISALAAGLAMGLPWYGMMFSIYGEQYLLAFGIPQGGAAAGASSGPLGIVLRIIESAPILAAALVWSVVAAIRRSYIPVLDDVPTMVMALWFVVGTLLAAFFTDRTMLSGAVLVPPASILAFRALEVFRRPGGAIPLILVYGAVVMASSWFVAQVGGGAGPFIILGVCLITAVAVGVVVASPARRVRLAAAGYDVILRGAVALTAIIGVLIVVRGTPSQVVGGRAVAMALREDTLAVRTFAYLYHGGENTGPLNGQLAWYTDGWMNGWRPPYRHTSHAMPSDAADVGVASSLRGASWVVYYHPGIGRADRAAVRDALGSEYDVHTESADYTLYRNR